MISPATIIAYNQSSMIFILCIKNMPKIALVPAVCDCMMKKNSYSCLGIIRTQ